MFCPPKPNMPVEVAAGVLAGAAELVAPNWKPEVPLLAGAAGVAPNWKDVVDGVAFPPKLNCGPAGAGVLGVAAADELAPPKLKAEAGVEVPFAVPNILADPDALLVVF